MAQYEALSPKHNATSAQIIDSAIAVHRALGPGLLESVYEKCLRYELKRRALHVDSQLEIPIQYGEIRIDAGLKLDLLVEDLVVVELKAVETILPLHEAQLLTYLRLARKQLGLLINFNVPLVKHGITRMVHTPSMEQ